jgi:hypothetical protein
MFSDTTFAACRTSTIFSAKRAAENEVGSGFERLSGPQLNQS